MTRDQKAPVEPSHRPVNPTRPVPARTLGPHAADQALKLSDGGAMRELGTALVGDRAVHARIEEGIRADVLAAMGRTAQLGADWILAKGQGR